MKPDAMLQELETAADRLAIKVSYEALQAIGSGGLCRVKGQYRVILDKRASTGEKVATLAQAIGKVGGGLPALSELSLSRPVRELVAHYTVRRAS
jgi:hypothetical protein